MMQRGTLEREYASAQKTVRKWRPDICDDVDVGGAVLQAWSTWDESRGPWYQWRGWHLSNAIRVADSAMKRHYRVYPADFDDEDLAASPDMVAAARCVWAQLAELGTRDRYVLTQWAQDATPTEIGRGMGLSRERARQLITSALEELRKVPRGAAHVRGRETLSTRETAKILGVTSRRTVQRWLEGGYFPGSFKNTRGAWRFFRDDVEAMRAKLIARAHETVGSMP